MGKREKREKRQRARELMVGRSVFVRHVFAGFSRAATYCRRDVLHSNPAKSKHQAYSTSPLTRHI